ncbi:(deoxy)nucleoside triphosphate pyrophosphohydrolase [Gilliamella sp. B2969]|uniref:(deoxy)nucleoside triphosphate pyrophosphohydrolase n=1 Tax=Gilliamella sp. B2969 TaxID=2818021 RepID=UPI00226A1EE1|nr:(deoxy)nucleoside triphosphate pyrophosphohydrolase [Gilliamella sp. B2969]MCX8730292.1 (deoxy)nucleoside triphosphate pyrophosphohydrolase [Gilliamella sp. B2969]
MNKFVHVVAAVIIKDGRFLCAQRGNTKYQAYKWEFPGGKVESGEQLEAALMREIKEELDCRISIKSHLLTISHNYDFGTVKIDAFVCELIDEQPLCLEHNEIRWLKNDEMVNLDWAEADLPIVTCVGFKINANGTPIVFQN